LEALSKAKTSASSASSGGGGGCGTSACHGSKECCQIDDQDFCLETAGCKWGKSESDSVDENDPDFDPDFDSEDSGEPCVGGPGCKGIDEKDMCEFTDGCRWTSDKDSVDLSQSSGAGSGDAGKGGDDHKKALFDPQHSFADDLKATIVNQPSLADMKKKAAAAKKPFMVLVTTHWCDACKVLVEQINAGTAVKNLFPSFVVGHAYGDAGIRDWQASGENYVPQAHFFDADGKPLNIASQTKGFKHFFMNDPDLASGMEAALRKIGAGSEL